MTENNTTALYYVHDPMCSWCWGFRPEWLKLKQLLPASLPVIRLVGGLAKDSYEPMPASLQHDIQSTWQRIQQEIPGTRFNFDFWSRNTPRRSTYPACRAVIAARLLAHRDEQMTHAIQQAYYLEAKNPSDLETLIEAADNIGLNVNDFEKLMCSSEIQTALADELERVRCIHVHSFPSLVLQQGGDLHTIQLDYNSAHNMLQEITRLTKPL